MRKPCVTALIFLSLLFLVFSPYSGNCEDGAVPSGAEDRGAGYLPYSEPTPLGYGGLFGAVVRTIFSLAIVIGLLYATLWVIKKFTGSAAGPYAPGAVGVVGRIYLSPKVVVYFVRLVDRLLVIGVNAGAISLLTTVEDEGEIAKIEEAIKGGYSYGSGPGFSRFFDKSMARFQKALDKEDSIFDEQLRTLNEQIGRLKGLARKRHRDDE